LVVTLDDIELVHLERVSFGLKNFDLVVIFKDLSRPVQHINTIPVESIDQVKDWLDSVEIPFYEGALNLQWPTIMKTVTADPHAFFEGGGWNFLSTDSDSENEESTEESAFEMDEEEFGASEESSAESDYDDNASADEEEEGEESDASDAESWGEIERKAAKSDKQHAADDSDEEKSKKRKR
jgi:nucleosome binding factor SPN SPT16 subunit